MNRSISIEFLNKFISGKYHSILENVKIDSSLNMELRGDRIIIYYRGGALLTITEKDELLKLTDEYDVNKIGVIPKVKSIVNYFCVAKKIIDNYVINVKNHLGEKEIQQYIAKENNYFVNSPDTDYYIIDTEYQEGSSRFDIVAIKWESKSSARKLLQTYKPTITIFEVKQGINSISGKSGMSSHLKDFNDFISKKSIVSAFKKDMLHVFKQKRELGLIQNMDKYKEIINVSDNIDFVFLLANYKSSSKQLINEMSLIDDCKFIYANSMGYGLYSSNVINKKEYIKRFC